MDNKGYLRKGVRTPLLYIIAALSVIFVLLNIACSATEPPSPGPAPTPSPSPAPPPSPTSSIKWSADGIINSGEYAGNKTYDDFSIHWTSDGEYIYIAMKAKTSGWVSMALQPGSQMKDADMVFGFVEDGETVTYDLFSTGRFGPHSPDSERGGSEDIAEFGGKEENGFTTIEFKRKLDTGDQYDHPFSNGINKIIWAWGTDDKQTLKHGKRGYGEIDI